MDDRIVVSRTSGTHSDDTVYAGEEVFVDYAYINNGGADIASLAGRLVIIMAHERRRFVERVDYITSPGHGTGSGWRKANCSRSPSRRKSSLSIDAISNTWYSRVKSRA